MTILIDGEAHKVRRAGLDNPLQLQNQTQSALGE